MIPRPPDANERMEKTADLNSCRFFYFYRVAPVQQMNRRKEVERRVFFSTASGKMRVLSGVSLFLLPVSGQRTMQLAIRRRRGLAPPRLI